MDAYHEDQSYNQQSFNQQSQPGSFERQIQSQLQSSNPVYLPQLPPSPGAETCDEIDYNYEIASLFLNFTHTPSSHISEHFTYETEGNQIKSDNDTRNILDLDLHKAQMIQSQNQQNMFYRYNDLYLNNQDQKLYIQTGSSSPSNQELFQSHKIPTEEYNGNAASTTQEPLDQSSLSSYRAFEHLAPQTSPSTTNNASWKSNKSKRPKTYNCTVCNKRYTNLGRLMRHYNTSTHKNVLKSIGQPNSGTFPISANHHSDCESTSRKVLTKNNEGKIICYECKKTFKGACYLTQHKNAYHSGEKPYKCIRCGKNFASDTKLAEHFQKHVGIKPHKCKMCPKQFNYRCDLNRHMYLHTGNEPYTCETCNKGFTRYDHMLKHYEIHTRIGQNEEFSLGEMT